MDLHRAHVKDEELGRFEVMFQVLSTRCHMATMRGLSKIYTLSYTLMHTPQSLPISATKEEWEGLLPILTNLKSEVMYCEKLNVQVRAGKILSDHSEGLSLLSLKSSEVLKYLPCKPLRFWLNLDKFSQSPVRQRRSLADEMPSSPWGTLPCLTLPGTRAGLDFSSFTIDDLFDTSAWNMVRPW